MRVVLLNPTYPPERLGPAERLLSGLAGGLARAGAEPRVVAAHAGRRRASNEDGVEVVRVRRGPAKRLRRRLYDENLAFAPLAYLELLRSDAEVVHAAHPVAAAAALRWRERAVRPVVFSVLELTDPGHLAGVRKRLELTQRALAGAALVCVPSAAAAGALERVLGVSAEVVRPGLDLDFWTPAGARAPEPTVFCADGGRTQLVEEAFEELARQVPEARLVAEPPAGIEALRGAYREAWVVLAPSSDDAIGLTAAEALACGTPVVGMRAGATPELVDADELGRLVDGDDPGQVAGALLAGLELAPDEGSVAARRARVAELSLDRFAERQLELYRGVLEPA